MNLDLLVPLLAAAIQTGTPILFATLGELFTERSGVLNLGVEGMMIVGALAAFWASMVTGNPWIGLLAGGLSGLSLAAVHGVVCLVFQGNQVVSGLALTIMGVGLAEFLGTPLIGLSAPGFFPVAIPGLSEIPGLGRVLFTQDVLVYISYLLPLLVWFLLRRTKLGLEIRSAGENPLAAKASGVRAVGMRWIGVLGGGFLVGIGGAYLSLAYTHFWTNGLTSGRGWIAVALVIFAFWKPWRVFLGAYLFGGVMAFQLRIQAVGTQLPSSLLLMLPYVLTVLVVVLSSWWGRGREAPAALGVNIEPEE
ncbi:MAG: ABC transporter permease [Desulfovibrionales bacterium]